MLVKKYPDTHAQDKEVLITLRKAIYASPELCSKKLQIEAFIIGINFEKFFGIGGRAFAENE